jgi:uncharacterized DUF497 family protein
MGSCDQFDWDDHNREHLAAHGLSPAEVEQVFANGYLHSDFDSEAGEPRWTAVGITNSGQVLVVVHTVRGEAIRPITGWDADDETSQLYFEQMGQ